MISLLFIDRINYLCGEYRVVSVLYLESFNPQEGRNMTTITIHNADKGEPKMILKAVERALYMYEQADTVVDIYVYPRVPKEAPSYKQPGWLEYGIVVKQNPGDEHPYYVAMVQRSPTHEVEFHS